jgi:hypothetical protein
MIRALLPAIGLVLLPALCSAQNDGGWWRQLFKPKQETTPNPVSAPSPDLAPAEPQENRTEPVGIGLEDRGTANTSGEPDTADDVSMGIAGSVEWNVSAEILRLDSGRPAPEDIRIPGYRVQIFMGRLDSARSLKRSLEEEGALEPVHVTPYPPLFGVTVGNVTTSLAAHRIREAWRPRFPNALVVPLELPLDSVFPAAGTPVHGRDLPPTHRD